MFYMRYDIHIGEARSRLASMLRLGDHVSFSVRYVWAFGVGEDNLSATEGLSKCAHPKHILR